LEKERDAATNLAEHHAKEAASLHAQLAAVVSARDELILKLDDTVVSLSSLTQSEDTARRELEDTRRTVASLRASLQQPADGSTTANAETTMLAAKVDELNRDVSDLRMQLRQEMEECAALRTQLLATDANQRSVEESTRALDEAHRQLQHKADEAASLRHQLDVAHQQYAAAVAAAQQQAATAVTPDAPATAAAAQDVDDLRDRLYEEMKQSKQAEIDELWQAMSVAEQEKERVRADYQLSLDELARQKADAVRQRDAASEACVELKRLVDQLRGEAAAASAVCDAAVIQSKAAVLESEDLRGQLASLREAAGQSHAEIRRQMTASEKTWEAKEAELMKRIEASEATNAKYASELDTVKLAAAQEVASLTSEMAALREVRDAHIQHTQSELQVAQETLAARDAEYARLQRDLDDLRAQVAKDTPELEALVAAKHAAEQARGQVQQAHDTATARIHALETQLAAAVKRAAVAEAQDAELRQQLAQAHVRLQEVTTRCAALEADLAAQQHTFAEKEARLIAKADQHAHQVVQDETQWSDLLRQVDNLQSQLAESEGLRRNMDAVRAHAQQRVADLEAAMSRHDATHATAVQETEALRVRLSDVEGRYQRQTEELRDLQLRATAESEELVAARSDRDAAKRAFWHVQSVLECVNTAWTDGGRIAAPLNVSLGRWKTDDQEAVVTLSTQLLQRFEAAHRRSVEELEALHMETLEKTDKIHELRSKLDRTVAEQQRAVSQVRSLSGSPSAAARSLPTSPGHLGRTAGSPQRLPQPLAGVGHATDSPQLSPVAPDRENAAGGEWYSEERPARSSSAAGGGGTPRPGEQQLPTTAYPTRRWRRSDRELRQHSPRTGRGTRTRLRPRARSDGPGGGK
jgi:chromosome segregation ATPase